MCGITGYTGKATAMGRLISGLKSLEYRGYDSAGVAFFDKSNELKVKKAVGKIACLEGILTEADRETYCGIGHTRWATHGAPSDRNSHPHGSDKLQMVHNGIIENYAELKEQLTADGYEFKSDTDTEVAALLIDKFYGRLHDPIAALREAESLFAGSYAIGCVFADFPGNIYVIRRDNPILIGKADDGFFVASDITAFLSYTKQYYRLETGELCVLSGDSVAFLDKRNTPIRKDIETAIWDISQAEKGGFDHFMAKEMHEECDVIGKTLHPRIVDGLPDFSGETIDMERIYSSGKIFIIGCGTAMHAGLYGKYMLEKFVRIPTEVVVASEFRYSNPILRPEDTVLLISQSGETADTLACLRMAKEVGAYTVGIVNVVASTIAREAEGVLYTHAGPEIAVASTKAYTVQTALMALFTLGLALNKGTLPKERIRKLVSSLIVTLPGKINSVLEREDEIKELARELKGCENMFFIGRCVDNYIAMEGSLKLKEISYIHSEAYAAGELKHGTISLIEEGMPVIAITSSEELRDKMKSNIKEVKARGAYVLTICSDDDDEKLAEVSNKVFALNTKGHEDISPLVCATALQLLAYHVALLRGCDIDKPRNLAKSVTVE